MAITHAIDIRIGFDLTKTLAPENIPGVMAYLGVDSVDNLTSAILQDKFNQINNLLANGKFNIIDAKVQTVTKVEPVQEKSKPVTKKTNADLEPKAKSKVEVHIGEAEPKEQQEDAEEKHEAPEIKDATNDGDLFKKKQEFSKRLLKVINKIKKNQGKVETIKYSPEIIPFAPSPEEVKHDARMSSDVTIDVEEIDEGLLATISYLDKAGKLKVDLLKEEK